MKTRQTMKNILTYFLFEKNENSTYVEFPVDDLLGKRTLAMIKQIPEEEIIAAKDQFHSLFKKAVTGGKIVCHGTGLERWDRIQKEGLKSDTNNGRTFFTMGYSSWGTSWKPALQVKLKNPEKYIEYIYPDPENYPLGEIEKEDAIMSWDALDILKRNHISLNILYWSFFNNLKNPDFLKGEHIRPGTPFPLRDLFIDRKLIPPVDIEIIPGIGKPPHYSIFVPLSKTKKEIEAIEPIFRSNHFTGKYKNF